ncbi:MAG: hypothetical protein F6K35_19480 [Okeania sp. SIO2H7]|nr:hypothetical protein [Okeania sp. SIO2H7]
MQDKQKVTLYLPPELHRQLKIRAAVAGEPMSSIAQRAIVFYLDNPEVIDEMGSPYGQTHRVYSCPECATSVFISEEGELASLKNQPGIIADELPIDSRVKINASINSSGDRPGEEELVPC